MGGLRGREGYSEMLRVAYRVSSGIPLNNCRSKDDYILTIFIKYQGLFYRLYWNTLFIPLGTLVVYKKKWPINGQCMSAKGTTTPVPLSGQIFWQLDFAHGSFFTFRAVSNFF